MSGLFLERQEIEDRTTVVGNALLAPGVSEDYWCYRVGLHEGQAVVGFPKFGTIGIGFAEEEDWNTNLPYFADAEEILEHIWHNAGPGVTRERALEAIEMIRQAAYADDTSPVRQLMKQKED